MDMTSLNVSLPKALKDYVENQVSEGGYSTPSEYVRALIREDHKRRAQEKLEGLLVEGLDSGGGRSAPAGNIGRKSTASWPHARVVSRPQSEPPDPAPARH